MNELELGLPLRTTHPNCPTCRHPSQHHEKERPPWRKETQLRCWGWWVELFVSQIKVTTFGTNEHHEHPQWLHWCLCYSILFYSILFYSLVVLCALLFLKMLAPCDVLQNYQSVCLATCEGSRNNARPTSWDSPPRPGVSSKSSQTAEKL